MHRKRRRKLAAISCHVRYGGKARHNLYSISSDCDGACAPFRQIWLISWTGSPCLTCALAQRFLGAGVFRSTFASIESDWHLLALSSQLLYLFHSKNSIRKSNAQAISIELRLLFAKLCLHVCMTDSIVKGFFLISPVRYTPNGRSCDIFVQMQEIVRFVSFVLSFYWSYMYVCTMYKNRHFLSYKTYIGFNTTWNDIKTWHSLKRDT